MERKLKILIATGLFPPEVGGPATYSKMLMDELPTRGFGVGVWRFSRVRFLPKRVRHAFYFAVCVLKGLFVDIIYAQDPVSVGLPAWYATWFLRTILCQKNKKFLLKIVGDYAWEQYQVAGAPFITPDEFQNIPDEKLDAQTVQRRKIERKVAMNADKVIVPSGYLKKIVSMWGVAPFEKNEERIMVINNSFEPPKVSFTKEEARKELGLERKIIFSAGRLVPWKGFTTLIEIMEDEAQAKLLIAGDGPDREKLETMIRDLKLQDRVILLGNLSHADVLKYLKASDMFVLNTGYEGFSHQILEALAMGCPIITTRVGGNMDIIADEKNGLLVAYNDKDALKTGIARLFNDDVLRECLVENGLRGEYAADRFTKERMIKGLESVLKLLPLS